MAPTMMSADQSAGAGMGGRTQPVTADLPDDLVMRLDEYAGPRMLTRQQAAGKLLGKAIRKTR